MQTFNLLYRMHFSYTYIPLVWLMPTFGFVSLEGGKWGISQAMLIADLMGNILGCN